MEGGVVGGIDAGLPLGAARFQAIIKHP